MHCGVQRKKNRHGPRLLEKCDIFSVDSNAIHYIIVPIF